MEIEPHEDDVFYDGLGMKLWEKRHFHVTQILESHKIKRVCDIGCNDGKFIRRLTRDDQYDLIAGLDVDPIALESAEKNSVPESFIINSQKENPLKVMLFSNSILKDCSFLLKYNFEAITLIEVIEHIEMEHLKSLEINVFKNIAPNLVIVTTPNYEFNRFFDNVDKPPFRHDDHKFEMTREEFKQWADTIAKTYGYNMCLDGVGLPKTNDTSRGFCTQIAVFQKQNFTNFSQSYDSLLEPQNEEIKAEIIYPLRKRNLKENFLAELNYAYHFVLTYSEFDLDAWGSNDEIEKELNNGFLYIKDLLAIKSLNDLLGNCSQNFLQLLKENLSQDQYQISSDGTRFKLITPNSDDEEWY